MDDLKYHYTPGTNKLEHVDDLMTDKSLYDGDLEDQQVGNYEYDQIGNLIRDNTVDTKEKIDKIEWTVYGKIKNIYKGDGSVISYTYDAAGNRVSKYHSVTGITTNYVRDAQGNMLAIYESGNKKEQYLYGSSRLGIWQPSSGTGDPVRQYELTNHLGNVLATISDKKVGHNAGNGTIDYYTADVVSAQDYYPFGMLMPGRTSASASYRYGYNGKENVSDVKGSLHQDYHI